MGRPGRHRAVRLARDSRWSDLLLDEPHHLRSPWARRLTLDRPGYGESTRLLGRTVADIVADVEVVADHLGVGQFAVSGGSGGMPACPRLQRISATVSCAARPSPAPYEAEGLNWFEGMAAGNIEWFETALAGEEAVRTIAEQERTRQLERLLAGRSDFLGDKYTLPEADQVLMEKRLERIADQTIMRSRRVWTDGSTTFWRSRGRGASMSDRSVRRSPCTTVGWTRSCRPPTVTGSLLIPHATVDIQDAGHGCRRDRRGQMAWLAGRG